MYRRKRLVFPVAVLVLFVLFTHSSVVTAKQGQTALPGGPCLVEAHAAWSEVEKWVWGRVCIGKVADLDERDQRSLDPAFEEGWDDRRLLRPDFLISILLHGPWALAVTRQGIRIKGAFFDAPIDLSEGRFEFPVGLHYSRFTEPVSLQRIETRSLVSLQGSVLLDKLNMDSATIGDSLFLRGGAKFTDVLLRNAKIGDKLDMTRASVSGNVSMDSATIGADVDMDFATFSGTLDMDSATIGGSLMMREGKFAKMVFRMAKVGGQLSMIESKITGDLNLQLFTIGGHLFMREARFAKPIDGVFVRIGGGVDLADALLADLDLTGAHIAQELRLAVPNQIPSWQDEAKLVLRNATVGALQDTPDAWPEHIDIDGFVYQKLGGHKGEVDVIARGAGWYADWLAHDEPYTPQPTEQLASVLRLMGHEEEANYVLYRGRERARSRALESGRYWSWAGQTLLKITIGYGYGFGYFRALYWVLGLVLMGTLLLRGSGQDRVPAQNNKPEMRIGLFYSLDMLLPIIQLRRRHYEVDLQGPVRHYFYFHQLMGYVLASFLIAGLSGLTK